MFCKYGDVESVLMGEILFRRYGICETNNLAKGARKNEKETSKCVIGNVNFHSGLL